MIERINSAFDVQAIVQEKENFIGAMEEANSSIKMLWETIKQYKGVSFGNIVTETVKLESATNKAISTTDKLNRSLVVAEELKAQQLKTEQEVIKAIKEEDKATRENIKTKEQAARTELVLVRTKSQLDKMAEKEKATVDKLTNAYEILKKEYTDASNMSKQRGAELLKIANGNEKVYRSLLGQDEIYQSVTDKAKLYYNQLDLLETETGQYQRRVGQYHLANTGLSNSINQLTRELPAFANSAQTGLMAISNNLPIFFDEIKRLQQANKDLVADGQKPVSVLKQLAGSFFSVQTALSVGITQLTVYGPKIYKWITEIAKGKDSVMGLAEATQELNEAVAKQAAETGGKEIASLRILRAEIESELVPRQKRLQAIKDLKKEYPEYFKSLSNEELMTGKVGNAYDLAAASIIRKAKANAAATEIEKISSENLATQLSLQLKAEETNKKIRAAKDDAALGSGSSSGMAGGNFGGVTKEEKQRTLLNEFNQQKKADYDLLALNQKKIDFLLKFALDGAKETIKIDEDTNKTERDLAKKRLDELSKEAKAAYEIAKMRAEAEAKAQKDIADNGKNMYAERILALQNYEGLQTKIIQDERDFTLQSEKLTASEREKVKVEAELKLNDLTKEGFKVRGEIIQNQKDEEQKLYDETTAAMMPKEGELEARAEKIKASVDKIFSSIDMTNSTDYTAELDILSKNLKDRKISVEKYLQEKAALEAKYARRDLSNAIAQNEAIISNLKALGVDTTDLEKQLNEQKRSLYNADAQAFSDSEQEKKDASQKTYEELQKNLNGFATVSSNIFQALGDIASIGFEKQKVAVEDLETSQQKAYEAEVKRITASSASEEEKANKLKILEAERQAQKEENDRKQRKIEVERAKFQKAQDIASIISGTAVAVINALGAKPYTPLNIAIAASIGALGAAQLARAIATPLPKYAVGTDSAKAGLALTDEKGPELYIEPSGKTYLGNNRPTLRNLIGGTKIIPADEVNTYLQDAMMRRTAAMLNNAQQYKESDGSDKITEAISVQTQLMLRELKRQKHSTSVTNVIDLGWMEYRKKKTFN